MKKAWWKWILLTLIVIALILLGVPIMLNCALGHNTPCEFEVVGTEVNWLDFWGAYIGAIIGGLITLIPMKRETDRNALNIMINNQENYIKELKSQLGNNICNLNFKSIGDFELPIPKNNKGIDKNKTDIIIKQLNDYQDNARTRLDTWNIIYPEDSGVMGDFNKAYRECVEEYDADVKSMQENLHGLRNSENRETEEYYKGQIIDFRNKLAEHQKVQREKMLEKAKKWLKEEQDELTELRNQLKSFYPRIKLKNNQ